MKKVLAWFMIVIGVLAIIGSISDNDAITMLVSIIWILGGWAILDTLKMVK